MLATDRDGFIRAVSDGLRDAHGREAPPGVYTSQTRTCQSNLN